MSYPVRLGRLQTAMRSKTLDALLVTHLPDVRYLCGFTGSNAALLVFASGKRALARLFTDGRYTAQARAEVRGSTLKIVKKSAVLQACITAAKTPARVCGFDANATSVAQMEAMRKATRVAGRPTNFLRPAVSLVAQLREIKDEDEVLALRRAAALGCTLYEGMLSFIEAGMREIDIAAELEHRARLAGAEAMSFETIVASGERSSFPHGRATVSRLREGDLLTLDFGIILGGYCSDMTRTVYLGYANGSGSWVQRTKEAEKRRVFEAVLEAQRNAVDAVAAHAPCGAVDLAARSVLKMAGLAKDFTHSTGHGLGLEIHEAPRIAAKQEQPLELGMVVTIEPGVYLPDRFGVRIEDMVLVTETGSEVLTPAFKGWTEL